MWGIPFYEATSQLLPLLFLTLVIEYRLLRPKKDTAWSKKDAALAALISFAAVTFAMGEWVCLHVLAFHRFPPGQSNGIIVAAFAIALIAFVGPLVDRASAARAHMRWRTRWTIFLGGFVAWVLLVTVSTMLV